MMLLLDHWGLTVALWVLMGLFSSRWVVGALIKDEFQGSVDRDKEVWGCIGVAFATVLFGPAMFAFVVFAFVWRGVDYILRHFWRSPIGLGMKRVLIYYYYLDRSKRKAALHR